MPWLSIILLAIAVSFDSLAIGISYGTARIEIPGFARLLLSIVSGFSLIIAMSIGNIVKQLSLNHTKIIGGTILILIGIYNIWRASQSKPTYQLDKSLYTEKLIWRFRIPYLGLIINVIKQPLRADFDYSKTISINEALLLGFALSLDAFASGIGAAVLGYSPFQTAIIVMIVNYFFVNFGLKYGNQWQNLTIKPLKWIPGIIIITLGFIKMVI